MDKNIYKIFLFSALFAFILFAPYISLAEEVHDDNTIEDMDMKYAPQFANKGGLEEKIFEEIPLAKELKPVWHLVDGDTDVFITNLRVDRNNKGLTYTTNTIPFVGTIDGLELKFKAGDDFKFSFESNALPLVGQVEGLHIKGSIGEESEIFARYTIAFD